MGLLDILDEAVRLYRSQFVLMATITLIGTIPSLAIFLLSGGNHLINAFSTAITHPNSQTDPSSLGYSNGIALLQYPVSLILLPFSTGPILLAAIETIMGRKTTLGYVYKETARRYFGLLLLNVILILGVLVPIACCIGLPLSIWLIGRWIPALPALLVERVSAGAALSRSWFLTDRAWTRSFGSLALVVLVGDVVIPAVIPVLVGLTALIPKISLDTHLAIGTVIYILVSQLDYPLVALVTALLYFDLRVRREAFDLEWVAWTELRTAPSSV
jgi:hypothetical protein